MPVIRYTWDQHTPIMQSATIMQSAPDEIRQHEDQLTMTAIEQHNRQWQEQDDQERQPDLFYKALLTAPTQNCLVEKPFVSNAYLALKHPDLIGDTPAERTINARCGICLKRIRPTDTQYEYPEELKQMQIGRTSPRRICEACFKIIKYNDYQVTVKDPDLQLHRAWQIRECNKIKHWVLLGLVNTGTIKTEGYIIDRAFDPYNFIKSLYNYCFSTKLSRTGLTPRQAEVMFNAPAFMPSIRRGVEYVGKLQQKGVLTRWENQFYDHIKTTPTLSPRMLLVVGSILAYHMLGAEPNPTKEKQISAALGGYNPIQLTAHRRSYIREKQTPRIKTLYEQKLMEKLGIKVTNDHEKKVEPQEDLYYEFIKYDPLDAQIQMFLKAQYKQPSVNGA